MRFQQVTMWTVAWSVCAWLMGGALAQEATETPATPEAAEQEVEVTITDVTTPHFERPMKIVDFEALAINRMTKYMVLLPEGYEENPEKRYPVLYLLHGFSQNYTVWPLMGLGQHLADLPLIVVMPDAGNTWYINWAENLGDEVNNWEDFIVYDLIHSVDQTFRTIPERAGRGIMGVSMGGYGAITIGLRHPGLFCTIASHSGVLDYARSARERIEAGEEPKPNPIPPAQENDRDANVPDIIRIPGFTMQHERYPNAIAFKTAEEARQYDPFELVLAVPPRYLPHIYIDCGLEDGLITTSQEFAALLISNGIPFAYGQTPGQHGVNYWSREMATSAAIQWAVLERNVARWEYQQQVQTSAGPDFNVTVEPHEHQPEVPPVQQAPEQP